MSWRSLWVQIREGDRNGDVGSQPGTADIWYHTQAPPPGLTGCPLGLWLIGQGEVNKNLEGI